MIPYPENKPTDIAYYTVELFDGTLASDKWDGYKWTTFSFNTAIVQFNPQKLGTRARQQAFKRANKQLIKV